jgi:hypothetical protein
MPSRVPVYFLKGLRRRCVKKLRDQLARALALESFRGVAMDIFTDDELASMLSMQTFLQAKLDLKVTPA